VTLLRTPFDELKEWWRRRKADSLGERWRVDEPADFQCLKCQHLREDTDDDPRLRCAAFPLGIPECVYLDQLPHNRPLPEFGQENDIVFAQKPGYLPPFWMHAEYRSNQNSATDT
jgi:hypothetical protein